MMPCVSVQQLADHPLVLSAVSLGLALEKFDAAFRKRDSHLHAFLTDGEFFGSGQKVRNDFQLSQGFVGVSDFRGHRPVCPFASNRHQ